MNKTQEQLNTELKTLGDRLRDMIMNDDGANDFVMRWAGVSYEHFVTTAGVDPEPKIRDELFCQYQVQLWARVFAEAAL